MQAKVRQRSLNEPNLYDKEIFRSMDNSNHEAEREWRLLRLESLLFLRAHGGSRDHQCSASWSAGSPMNWNPSGPSLSRARTVRRAPEIGLFL